MRLHPILESALKHAERIDIESNCMLITYGSTTLTVTPTSLALRCMLGSVQNLDRFTTKTNIAKVHELIEKTFKGFDFHPGMHSHIYIKRV